VDWHQKSYTVSAGIHILKWRYVKNWEDEDGDDCGWVDYVQWSGPSPQQDTSNWQTINYKHDVYGRRSEKKVDGYSTRYVYDGGHVIAEYDSNNNLLRKYIYGPGIDQPVCMIEVADSNAIYYYHFDALGSVVALSDSAGDTVQTYQYTIFGEVWAEDIDHPNPYMFAGVHYDIEIGLYYNRARYYNPYTGRFLQTDPAGDGMNLYSYCANNSLNCVDPSGLAYMFLDSWDKNTKKNVRGQSLLTFAWINDDDPYDVKAIWSGGGIDEWCNWAASNPDFDGRDDLPNIDDRSGWDLAQRLVNPGDIGTHYTKEGFFWRLQALEYLGVGGGIIATLENSDELQNIKIKLYTGVEYREYENGSKVVEWNPTFDLLWGGGHEWNRVPPLALLLHELTHAADDVTGGIASRASTEIWAMKNENDARYAFWSKVPHSGNIYPRPGYYNDAWYSNDLSSNSWQAWYNYFWIKHKQVFF